jgi:RNA polymerase sigma-70 factor (ECF subfamily)
MVGPGSDAEDLTQETFVRAYMNIKSFQSRASLNTWLYRIATNVCIDHSRKSRKLRDITAHVPIDDEGDLDIVGELPDERFDPQAVLLNRELGARLEQSVRSLPEKLRSVILLHDIEGLPYDEIAHILDCPLGTVKSRLFNARSALRDKLQPYLEGAALL